MLATAAATTRVDMRQSFLGLLGGASPGEAEQGRGLEGRTLCADDEGDFVEPRSGDLSGERSCCEVLLGLVEKHVDDAVWRQQPGKPRPGGARKRMQAGQQFLVETRAVGGGEAREGAPVEVVEEARVVEVARRDQV